MPYRNRRRTYNNRGRRKRLSKTYVTSKKGATSQSRQIMSLQRQVNRISVTLRDRTQYSQYQMTHHDLDIGHGIALPGAWQPAIYRCISPDNWGTIFQTPDENVTGNEANKFRGRSIGFEHMIQLADPQVANGDPVTCTLFCVSLKKETATQFLQDSSFFTALSQGRHYCQTTMGNVQGSGMVMLNKGIFNIRYMKRFMIGKNVDFSLTEEVQTTNLADNNKRIYTRIRYPNLLKSGRGDTPWKDMQLNDIEATDHLCWMLFHNAYAAQTLSWNVNGVITGKITN